MNEKIYPKIEGFNDHKNCSGHANYMLDCEYTKKEEREQLISVLNNYITDEA